MTIIIDVTRLVRRLVKGRTLTGIDRVSMAYVEQYKHTAQALVRWCGRSWVLSSAQSKALFTWLITPGSTMSVRWIMIKGIFSYTTKKNTTTTFLLNTGHIGLGQSDYLRMMRTQNVQPIFFVHDLIPITHPEYSNPGEDKRYSAKMDYVLRLARGVIINSVATQHDFVRYASETNQNMPQTSVALLASGLVPIPPGKRPIDKPYFVILSTIEPRKNHMLLLHIWRNLVQIWGEKTPHLFVIGQRGWECEQVLDLLDRCQFLKGVVTELSRCSDAELVTYIHHSQAMLFPSFIEGYGLPLIEALTLNIPVIASDIPVFREIVGPIAEFADPLDGARWQTLIMDYAEPSSRLRDAQMKRIQAFRAPTWKEHFMHVDAFLAELSATSQVKPC